MNKIPIELWNNIFFYLKIEDLFRFSQTNKSNYEIAHNITIYLELAKKGQDPKVFYHYFKKKYKIHKKIKNIKFWSNLPYKAIIFIDNDLKSLINIKNKKNCTNLSIYHKRVKKTKKETDINDTQYKLWDKCNFEHLSYMCFDNYKNYINFERLSHLYKLQIIGYKYSINLNSLRNIKILIFNDCPEIRDISPLSNNNYLQFEWCENLKDVSQLDKVSTLKLYNCLNITNIESLGKIPNLHIYGLYKINNIDVLKNNKILVIDNYPYKGINELIKHYMDKKEQTLRVYS